MKRKVISGAAFLLLAWAVNSCSDLGDCQTCKIVTRNTSDDSIVTSDGGTEYCGTEIDDFKAANPTITNPVLGTVTQVECN
ncbi:MAG: hypothetical protein IPN67_09400 [Bacteroidales bacterium]|nr:hypothetical protein [Bacteroidales bacterium]MBK8882573.1 hypothetical protein [Bacteroidales bacterium]